MNTTWQFSETYREWVPLSWRCRWEASQAFIPSHLKGVQKKQQGERSTGVEGKGTLGHGPGLGGLLGEGKQPEGNLHTYGLTCGSQEKFLLFLSPKPLLCFSGLFGGFAKKWPLFEKMNPARGIAGRQTQSKWWANTSCWEVLPSLGE